MTTRFQPTGTPATDQNFRTVEGLFPVREIADGVVTADQIKAGAVTDAKLAEPVLGGSVKANGEKESGEGFTSEKTATGKYTVKLTAELASTAIVVLTSLEGNLVRLEAAPGKKEFKVGSYLINTVPVATDFAFTFMVKAS